MSEPQIVTEATVEWYSGSRMVNRFMDSADLGISAAGVRERIILTYAPGEEVDEERVLKAVNHMIKELDDSNDLLQIWSPKVISIVKVEKVLNPVDKTETVKKPSKVTKKAKAKAKPRSWWNSKKGLI